MLRVRPWEGVMQKKHEIKLLVLSDIMDFKQDDVLTRLDMTSRRHYDMIIGIGDIPQAILDSLNSQFDSSLIALLPKTKRLHVEPTDGIEYFNLRKYFFSGDGTILGYGSSFDNRKPVPIGDYEKYTADILVSYYPPKHINIHKEQDTWETPDPIGHDEVNRYGAFQNPKFILHGCRKNNYEHELSNGTKIISVYGMQEKHLIFKK